MKKVTLLLFALLCSASSFAQNIKGRVVDNNNAPLPGANVLLLSKADSAYLEATTTREDGQFELPDRSDAGMLMFSYIGYKSLYHNLDGKTDVGTITMQEDEQLLKEVNIVGSRIINNSHGYSFNPSGSGLDNCNTTQNLFAFLPGISVSENKISVLGRFPVIYVNGFKITSQDELDAILPKNIEKIEVDYIATGEGATEKGGVIRITTKKVRDGGYSGYLRLNAEALASYGYNFGSPTFVVAASSGKWTLNYYAIYQNHQLLGDEHNDYLYDSGRRTNMFSKIRSWSNRFTNRLNLSYEINSRSTVAISEYIGNFTTKNNQKSLVETFLKGDESRQESEEKLSGPESNFSQQTVAKYILDTDDKGSRLEVTGDYYFRNYHLTQKYDINGIRNSENSTKEKINMFQFFPKYTHSFSPTNKLEGGAFYRYIRYNDRNNELRNNADAHVTSGYANFSGMAKKMMYSAGMTLQYNGMDVRTSGIRTSFDDFYLCPQASLMWMADPQKGRMLGLIYQCSVDEMPYSVINNYKNYSAPYHYTSGNPNLSTPIQHEAMVNFAFDSHISMVLMYVHMTKPIYYEHGVDAQNQNITWARPENGRYRDLFAARVEFSYSPTKWWKTKFQTSAMKDIFVSKTETLKGKWCGKFWWDNNFNFTPTFGGSLNAYYETGLSFENYSWRPVGNVNASLWKSLCDNKLRLSLESTIWAKGRKSRTTGDAYTSYYRNTTKMTSFSFTLTWRFSGGKKVRQRDEAESVQDYNKIEETK